MTSKEANTCDMEIEINKMSSNFETDIFFIYKLVFPFLMPQFPFNPLLALVLPLIPFIDLSTVPSLHCPLLSPSSYHGWYRQITNLPPLSLSLQRYFKEYQSPTNI